MNPPIKLPSEIISEMDKLYGQIEVGAAADTILRVIDPIVEQRLGELLTKLEQAPPELGAILDIRAKICEVWRMRRRIKERNLVGKNAVGIIKGLFEVEEGNQITNNNNGRPVTGQH